MLLSRHYQNAYVTRDLEIAIKLLGDWHGVRDFWPVEAEFVLKTPDDDKSARMRVALGWAGDLQIELIQPVSSFTSMTPTYLKIRTI